MLSTLQPRPRLRPPLGPAALDKLATPLPYALPDDVRTIYEWHDGEEGPPGFLQEFRLMPLHSVVEHVVGAADFRPRGWLPLLTNWGGDFLYLDMSGGGDGSLLLLRVYDGIRDEPMYDSLPAFFATVLEGHRARVFRMVQRGAQVLGGDGEYRSERWTALEVGKRRQWEAICARMNPRSWK